MKTLLPALSVTRTLAVLALLSAAVQAADLTTDTLTVNDEANFYGPVTVGTRAPGVAPTNGLVLHYDFNLNQTNVLDGSGYGRTGLAVGGISWTTNGVEGGCFQFDGANDYVNSGYNMQSVVRAGAFSFSIWFNTDDGNATAQYPFGSRNTTPNDNRSALLLYGSGGLGYLDLTHTSVGAQYSIWPAQTYGDGPSGWQHLVATVDDANNQLRVYLNGAEDANSPRSITMTFASYTNSFPVFIGALNNNGTPQSSQYFDGYLDEFRIYDRVLDEDEALALYTAVMPAVPTGDEGLLRVERLDVAGTNSVIRVLAPTHAEAGIVYHPALGDLSMGSYTNQP